MPNVAEKLVASKFRTEIASLGNIMTIPRARVTAPFLHGFLFTLTWVLYWIQPQPLLDGPSRWPFALVFFGDLPISVVAFGVMFGSNARMPYALAAWAVLGTLWWYFLGRLIEELASKRNS